MNLHDLLDDRAQVPTFDSHDVHVWRVSTQIPPEHMERLVSLLSADESVRASRFHFERDRSRFIASRSSLRLLAAAYSGERPEGIRFRHGHLGKPALSDLLSAGETAKEAANRNNLQFNVSHSGELALLAFSAQKEIGVDVEFMRPDLDFLSLARSSFSPDEYQAIAAANSDERPALFYEYWSCKEACIKADGRGVSVGLDQFAVISSEEPMWRKVSVAVPCTLSREMRVQILEVGKDYAAAIAAAGRWHAALFKIE